MSQLNFIESNRGGNLAVVNGFIFTLKQRTKTNTHWRCSSYQSLKYPATIKTYGNELIEEKGEHNHEMESGKSEAKKVVNSLKRQAIQNTPTVALANAIADVSNDYAVQLALPNKDNLIRTASRQRQREKVTSVPAPVDRHFEIPEEFQRFLLSDSGRHDPERIMLFGEPEMKHLLGIYVTWLADGTFKL